MKRKFAILLFCYITFSLFATGQVNVPGMQVDGTTLKRIFTTYEFIVVKVAIDGQKNASFTIEGVNVCDTTIIATFSSSGFNYPVSNFINSPLVCFGKYSTFIPVDGRTYFIVPKVLSEAGGHYLHLRIKRNTSTTSSYYKSINPIPPDHPGFMKAVE